MRGFTPPMPANGDGNGFASAPVSAGGESFGGYSYPALPQPIVLQHGNGAVAASAVDKHEEVEESLSLTDREKEFISKALKKHRGRRRDAASELGISERTLYRKIKEYGIKE